MRGHYQHAIRGTQSPPAAFDANSQQLPRSATAAEMLYNPVRLFYLVNFTGLLQKIAI
jgi:hypothetical protein